MSFKKFFSENNLQPAPDKELSALLEQALSFMEAGDLAAYIKSVQMFNKSPVHICKSYPGEHRMDFGSATIVHWYDLRKNLKIMPQYFETAAKAGLSYTESMDLLSTMIASEKYDFNDVSFHINVLTKILNNCVNRQMDSTTVLPALKSVMEMSKKDGELGRALGIIMLGVNAGMDLAQSADIVKTIYDRSAIAGYVLMRLYDELNLLASNTADGTLLYQSLQKVMGRDPYYEADFKHFTQVLYMLAANTEHSQKDVLQAIGGKPANRLLTQANENFEGRQLAKTQKNPLAKAIKLLPAKGKAAACTKEPNDYFPALDRPRLVHGILPYRMERDFYQGIADLKDLMSEEYMEGAFIFDPENETWYSLGGRTQAEIGRVRQEFFPYDIAKLSANPVFVHIHPEQLETFISPSRDSLAYPQFQQRLTKFIAAMPSKTDFETIASMIGNASSPVALSAFIVTSTGLTEMRFPNNAESVRKFSEQFSPLKDKILMEFDAHGYLLKNGINQDYSAFVCDLVKKLNKLLPSGFEILQYPYEAIFQPQESVLDGKKNNTQPKQLNFSS